MPRRCGCRRPIEATAGSHTCEVAAITDAAGSQWSVRSLGLSDKLQWTTPTGLSIAQAVDKIVQIDFSGGKIVYLSDMKPEDVRWTPYFDAGKPPPAMAQFYASLDRSFDGGPLQLGGTPYRKGRFIAAPNSCIACPTGSAGFAPVVGIDDAVRPGGKVRLVVRGDGRELLDATVAGSDPPRPVDGRSPADDRG